MNEEDKVKLKALIPKLKHSGYSDGDDGYYSRELSYDEWYLIIKACEQCSV
jgi:hypothetical protein